MSEKLIIKGGKPLIGKTEVRGSKNSAPKMMVASLLSAEPCIIENVPMSLETEITKELCENIGSVITLAGDHTYKVATREVKSSLVPEFSRRNRISVLAIGPLLHRKGFAEVPVLGGCPIGHRPINFHVEALSRMGIRLLRRENSYYAEAEDIHGAEIEFPYPSVGATESVILTATLARGRTFIKNAAVEPEIFNLVGMLKEMGAEIDFKEKSREVKVEGVKRLYGARVRVMPDRNEVVSLATAAMATQGEVLIQGAEAEHLGAFLEKIKEIGGEYEAGEEGVKFKGRNRYNSTFIKTSPHPDFMTDWQQPVCILLTQARGESIIHETVYEDRFGYTKDLKRMGADIEVSDECPMGSRCRFFGQNLNHSAKITGPTRLRGGEITMTDIRAGMAHLIAALSAEGESVVSGVEHLDRGYERIDERLRQLGADISRI